MTHPWKQLFSLTVTLSLTFLVACGSEDEGTPADETPTPKITGTLQLDPIPTGSPKNLAITGFANMPATGSPDAIISMYSTPEFTNGLHTLSVEVEAVGTYFLFIAVYFSDQQTQPEVGTDYVASTSSALEFGTEDVNVGTLTAVPYQAPGG